VRECPAMRLSVIPGAGHVPMLEAPEAFNVALRSAITDRMEIASPHRQIPVAEA